MNIEFIRGNTRYASRADQAHTIAIELDFEGSQPNHFGANRADREALRLGDFVGSTRQGGSCNVDELKMVPHCNGTHTETVSHIVDDEIWIGHLVTQPIQLAVLMTVTATKAGNTQESYRPKLDPTDQVITASSLRQVIGKYDSVKPDAWIIRTLPNDPEKKSQAYTQENQPAFLTIEAMELIVETAASHLLVDLPSVDRMYDEGLLTNHHLFWNVPEGKHQLQPESHQQKTITEMIYVDDEIKDGLYGISLQIPAFCSDAAPSRPVIFPVQRVE